MASNISQSADTCKYKVNKCIKCSNTRCTVELIEHKHLWMAFVLDWDETLLKDLRTSWFVIARNLQQTPTFSIPRYCFDSAHSNDDIKQIHIFVDISIEAYGAVAYIHQDNHSFTSYVKDMHCSP